MIVKVNNDVIKKESNAISNYILEYRNNLTKINNTLSDMGGIWKDSSYIFFNKIMQDFVVELTKIQEQLESYNEYIKGYTMAIDSLDTAYSKKRITIE